MEKQIEIETETTAQPLKDASSKNENVDLKKDEVLEDTISCDKTKLTPKTISESNVSSTTTEDDLQKRLVREEGEKNIKNDTNSKKSGDDSNDTKQQIDSLSPKATATATAVTAANKPVDNKKDPNANDLDEVSSDILNDNDDVKNDAATTDTLLDDLVDLVNDEDNLNDTLDESILEEKTEDTPTEVTANKVTSEKPNENSTAKKPEMNKTVNEVKENSEVDFVKPPEVLDGGGNPKSKTFGITKDELVEISETSKEEESKSAEENSVVEKVPTEVKPMLVDVVPTSNNDEKKQQNETSAAIMNAEDEIEKMVVDDTDDNLDEEDEAMLLGDSPRDDSIKMSIDEEDELLNEGMKTDQDFKKSSETNKKQLEANVVNVVEKNDTKTSCEKQQETNENVKDDKQQLLVELDKSNQIEKNHSQNDLRTSSPSATTATATTESDQKSVKPSNNEQATSIEDDTIVVLSDEPEEPEPTIKKSTKENAHKKDQPKPQAQQQQQQQQQEKIENIINLDDDNETVSKLSKTSSDNKDNSELSKNYKKIDKKNASEVSSKDGNCVEVVTVFNVELDEGDDFIEEKTNDYKTTSSSVNEDKNLNKNSQNNDKINHQNKLSSTTVTATATAAVTTKPETDTSSAQNEKGEQTTTEKHQIKGIHVSLTNCSYNVTIENDKCGFKSLSVERRDDTSKTIDLTESNPFNKYKSLSIVDLPEFFGKLYSSIGVKSSSTSSTTTTNTIKTSLSSSAATTATSDLSRSTAGSYRSTSPTAGSSKRRTDTPKSVSSSSSSSKLRKRSLNVDEVNNKRLKVATPTIEIDGPTILAKWVDKTFYPGKITETKPGNKYVVVFVDGQTKTVRKDSIIFTADDGNLPLKDHVVHVMIDNNYEAGVVEAMEKNEDNIMIYTVATDNKTVQVQLSEICVKDDVAKTIQNKSTPPNPDQDPNTTEANKTPALKRKSVRSSAEPGCSSLESVKGRRRQNRYS